jgi:hypothetical protein
MFLRRVAIVAVALTLLLGAHGWQPEASFVVRAPGLRFQSSPRCLAGVDLVTKR